MTIFPIDGLAVDLWEIPGVHDGVLIRPLLFSGVNLAIVATAFPVEWAAVVESLTVKSLSGEFVL